MCGFDGPRRARREPVKREPARGPHRFAAPAQHRLPHHLDADGSPQITQTWVDTDGEHVVINTVQGFQKVKNVECDPRVAVAVADPSSPSRYYAIRGRVVNVTTEGGAEHIEALAQRYLGAPYPWYGGQVRVILTISADKIHGMDR
jgi:PPOX class probable F420-dependent enzyme